ncbi:MAG TPA: PilZ domain-containing protein [Gemmataceae bacterium]|nr:PilZ domain-containing protein [Gemmataceae bacterium]
MHKQTLSAQAERRAHVRYSHTLRTSCRPLGKGAATWPATIQDLSRAGVALAMGREVRPGAVLVVALEGLGGRFSRPLLLRVLNVRPAERGGWHVGCAFVTPLTDNDVQALLLTRPLL